LYAVKGQAVRPTADRVKEALFSILGSRFDLSDGVFMDLFAGSGGIGIEALSRGAAHVTFVEQHSGTCQVLRDNLTLCRFQERATVRCMPVDRALRAASDRGETYGGVFVDPPYGRGLAREGLEQLAALRLLPLGGWVMVEHHADDALAARYGPLHLTLSRRYGKTCLALYQWSAESQEKPY
jgi:16S rRNA (guanine(966)-N(2))-methyltransferase RsmD